MNWLKGLGIGVSIIGAGCELAGGLIDECKEDKKRKEQSREIADMIIDYTNSNDKGNEEN